MQIDSQRAGNRAVPGARRSASARRLPYLFGLLALLALAWPLSRAYLAPKIPPRPAANAEEAAWTHYYQARIKAYPDDADAYLQLGLRNLRRGYTSLALERLLIARALGAPEAETTAAIGRCHLNLSRYDEARAELEKAARLAPNDVDAALDLARLYHETRGMDDAKRVLAYFLKSNLDLLRAPKPSQREAVEKLMNAFTRYEDPQTALLLAEQIMRLAPNEPNGYAVAGRHLLNFGQVKRAAEVLEKATELEPKQDTLRLLYGLALANQGQRDKALEQWQKATELAENPYVYAEIAKEYARRKDWRRAGIAYMRVGAIEKTNPTPYERAAGMWEKLGDLPRLTYCRGRAAQLSGKPNEALKAFRLLATHPDPGLRQRGIDGAVEVYRQRPDKKNLKELVKFLETTPIPNPTDRLMYLADAYGEMDDFPRRRTLLKQALAHAPHLAGHIHHELGKVCANTGDRDGAEEGYRKAIAADPEKAEYRRTLGELYLERRNMGNRLALATAELEKLVQLEPFEAKNFHKLGVAYAAAGDYGRAIPTLQHALDLQPGFGPAYFDLGQAYRKIGEKARSEEMLALYRRFQQFDLEKQTLTTRARANSRNLPAQMELADFFAQAHDYGRAGEYYLRAIRIAPSHAEAHRKLAQMYGLTGNLEAQRAHEQVATRLTKQ
jgi:tetratricopeptide (TPR) repeat protein